MDLCSILMNLELSHYEGDLMHLYVIFGGQLCNKNRGLLLSSDDSMISLLQAILNCLCSTCQFSVATPLNETCSLFDI